MVVPTLFVGVQAIRTNALERATLETLGQRLARSRTYADVEDGMFNQTQVVWRYLGGDPTAKQEFPLTGQVVDFRLARWTADLPADEVKLADGVRRIEADIRVVAARVFQLHDAGQRDQAALVARRELLERLQPALAGMNREIYRQARELSVQGALPQMQTLVASQRRRLSVTATLRSPASSSTRSWSKSIDSISASPTCCSSPGPLRSTPYARACGRWSTARSPDSPSCCASARWSSRSTRRPRSRTSKSTRCASSRP